MNFYQPGLAQECVNAVAISLPPDKQDAARAAMLACVLLYAEKLECRFQRLYPLLAPRVLSNGERRQLRSSPSFKGESMRINEDFRCPRCRRWLRAAVGNSTKCPTCGAEARPPSLVEDAAKCIALRCVEIIENLLRPEERAEAYREFVATAVAGIEAYLLLRRRGLGEAPSSN